MRILAIETSCDDTAAAIVDDFQILSNIVSSQVKIHRKWGGVYPSLAKREHQENLVPVLKKALKGAGLLKKGKNSQEGIEKILKREETLLRKTDYFLRNFEKPDIDAIAITVGPGLAPCLWAGVNFAKALSFYWNIPLIPVNHIEAHFLVSLAKKHLPAVSLVVSGGHTQLILVKKIGKYEIIGETRDDAAGECFDKTARILGLDYPGGPEIARMAKKFKKEGTIKLPRPMINSKDYDFSFSGLKTAVLYQVKKDGKKSDKQMMAKEIQQAIIDVLIKKTIKAAKDFKVKTIVLGGGVSANLELRRQFKIKAKDFNLFIPSKKMSADNAAMIGIAAFYKKAKNWKNIKVNANLRV